VKRWIPLVLAGAAVAFVLFRPAPPPTAGANGWSAVTGEPSTGRARRTPAPRAMVYVAGEVMRPGVYPVAAEARVRDALALAGGARPNADLLAVNLAAHVRDGDEIAVPARGAEPAPASHRRARGHAGGRKTGGHGARAGHGKHRRARRDQAPPVAEVDINTADAEALAAIPGIGEGLALRIVEFRRQNGPFASVDELLDVAGITEHRLDAMIPYVVAR
jgi:competence protein ComEA